MKRVPVVALVALCFLAPAAAVQSARPPALLTFALTYGPDAKGGGICVARPDGSHRVRLAPRRNYRQPDWSPRGRFMVTEFAQELRVVDTRGRVFYVLPSHIGGYDILESEPSWSPDSTRIAYRAEFRTFSSIYVVTRTGGLVHTLEREYGAYAGSPTWSPDSKRLAYEKAVNGEPTSIYTSRSDGSQRRLVLNSASDPDWSPDGSRLAYVTPGSQGSEIATANVDGSDARLLTSSPERESTPAWSPDGKLIAFERTDGGRSWIVVVRSNTGAEVGVVRGAFDAHDPGWRPPVVLPKAKRQPCR